MSDGMSEGSLRWKIEQQEAEIERLKAALQQIAGERDCPDYLTPSEIARAALEGK